jgi:hypothetical protein
MRRGGIDSGGGYLFEIVLVRVAGSVWHDGVHPIKNRIDDTASPSQSPDERKREGRVSR